jgi:hypothetical protein
MTNEDEIHGFWIYDNRILLSILFGLSGIIFLLLFLDSHYKEMIRAAEESIKKK